MMLRKFYYLTSVSVLASMVMNLAAQAMEPEREPLLIKTSSRRNNPIPLSKENVNNSASATTTINNANSLYYDLQEAQGKDDHLKSPFTCISEEADTYFWDNINGKVDTFFKLQRQIRSGNYDELAGEVIESLIATLAGETQKSLFGKVNNELDPEVLRKASKNLVDKFLKYLSINKDLYGETASGEHVTIYNKSLFKMFAQKYFPETPITGIAITLLDNNYLKDFVTNKLIETTYGYFQKSLKKQGITVKEMVGQEAVKFCHSMLYDESTIDFKEVWGYLSPHLSPLLRDYMIPLLKEAKNLVIKKTESDLWKLTVGATGASSGGLAASVTYFVVGPVLTTVGTYISDPLLTLGGCLGSFVGSALVGASTGAYSSLKADAYFHSTKNYLNQYLDDRLELLAEELIPYTPEEWVLYKLNSKPTDIEIGLYNEDYKLLKQLNEQTYMNGIGIYLAKASGVSSLLEFFFKKDEPALEIKYHMHEEYEQAYRRLMRLRLENPETAKNIEKNLRDFPSFSQRNKRLNQLKNIGLEQINSEKIPGQRDIESRQQVVEKIRKAANVLSGTLYEEYKLISSSGGMLIQPQMEQHLYKHLLTRFQLMEWAKQRSEEGKPFSTKILPSASEKDLLTWIQRGKLDNPFYETLIEEILSTSIESQDYFIEWMEQNPKGLESLFNKYIEETAQNNKGLLKYFAKDTVYTDLFEENGVQVNKATIKNFVQWLMEKSVKPHIEEDRKNYITKYHDSISALSSNSLTKRMDQAQIVYLHKRQMAAGNNLFEKLPHEIQVKILNSLNNNDIFILDDQDLISFAYTSRKFYTLPLDIMDDRKIEKFFNIEELDAEEHKFFQKHRHDMLLMDAVYRELKLSHSASTLYEILNDYLKQMKVLERVKNNCIKHFYFEKNVSFDIVFDKFDQLLRENKDYNHVSDIIREIKNKEPQVACRYDALREVLITDTVEKVSEELNIISKNISAPEGMEYFKNLHLASFSQNETGGFLSNWRVTAPIPLTQEIVLEKYQKAQKELKAHDKSSEGWRTFNLAKKLSIEHQDQLSLRNFIKIYKNMGEKRLYNSCTSDKNYILLFGDEVNSFKLGSPIFRNKLFYDYDKLLKAMREQHERFLNELCDL